MNIIFPLILLEVLMEVKRQDLPCLSIPKHCLYLSANRQIVYSEHISQIHQAGQVLSYTDYLP